MIGIEEVKRAKEVINTCIIKNMMHDTPLIRSASISEIAGTEVVIAGSAWKETYEKALEISREYGCDYIDPGEDESLIAGIAIAIKEISTNTRVIGVEPEHMNAMYPSFHSGKIETIKRIPSVADGLGGISPCVLPYEIVSRYVDDMITVSEKEIKEATRLILQRTKMLAEPSGATALAGLLSGKAYTGKKNVCIVFGGNAEPEVLAEILSSTCYK